MAQKSIGNFKLKSDSENLTLDKNPENKTLKKFVELKSLKEEIHQMKSDFNKQVFAARQRKTNLCDFVKQKMKRLEKIQEELPPDQIKIVEVVPVIKEDVEFFDEKFQVNTRKKVKSIALDHEYCFHLKNNKTVKNKLNLENIYQKILTNGITVEECKYAGHCLFRL